MRKLIIEDRRTAGRLCQKQIQGRPTFECLLSIGTTQACSGFKQVKVPKIFLPIDDVTDPQDPTAANLSDVERVINFARRNPGKTMLVHCEAGISRSTAMGIVVLMADGVSYAEAEKEVRRRRPVAWPNTLIIRYAKHLLDPHTKELKEAEDA